MDWLESVKLNRDGPILGIATARGGRPEPAIAYPDQAGHRHASGMSASRGVERSRLSMLFGSPLCFWPKRVSGQHHAALPTYLTTGSFRSAGPAGRMSSPWSWIDAEPYPD